MYKVYHKVAIIFLSLFIFTSCKNLFEDSVDETEEIHIEQTGTTSSTPASSAPAPAAKQKITFGGALQVEGALPSKLQEALSNPGDTNNDPLETADSRSARPTITAGGNYEYYVRAYTDDGANPVEVIPVENTTTHKFEYSLELELEHTWKFEAGFRRKAVGDDPVRQLLIDYDSKRNAPFSLDLHIATGGLGEPHTFILVPSQTANGKGSIYLSMDISGADYLVVTAVDESGIAHEWNGNNKVSLLPPSDPPSAGTWYIKSDGVNAANLENIVHNVKSGSYELTLMFYKNYTITGGSVSIPVYTTYQTINVFDNMLTDTWVNENAAVSGTTPVINSSGDFEVTAAMVTASIQRTIYVGVPDSVLTQIPTLEANDSYTGSPFAPLANLTTALNKIQARGTGGAYNIYLSGTQSISGNFTIPSGIDSTKASSITITTADRNASSAILNGDGNGTVLTIESAVPVTITKIQITGGKATNGNGGGIFMDTGSKVTLGNGAVIGNANANSPAGGQTSCANYAATAGGGIYCKGQLTLKSGSVVGYNYVNDSGSDEQEGGGGIYCEDGSVTLQNGAKVSCNGASHHGGGICLYSGNLTMTAGEITNNAGNAVCVRGTGTTSTFTLGGSAKITAGNSAGSNDIYLDNKVINLTTDLSQHDEDHPVAVTTTWARGKNIISLGTAISNKVNAVKKFKLTANADDGWEKKLSSNTVTLDAPIYIGGTNESGTGIFSDPFKNISQATSIFNDPTLEYTIRIKGTTAAEQQELSGITKEANAKSIIIEGYGTDAVIDRHASTAVTAGSALVIDTNIPVTIKNLTIKGGNKDGNGGGLCISNSSASVALGNGVVINHNQATKGGGVSVVHGASLFMYGSALIGDSASSPVTENVPNANWTNCGNYASGTGSGNGPGGGIYNEGSVYLGYSGIENGNLVPADFTGGIKRNLSRGQGAGICNTGTDESNKAIFKLRSGLVSYNTGAVTVQGVNTFNTSGGGISAYWTDIDISDGEISYNHASTGGGLSIAYHTTVNYSGGIIKENAADNGNGGALTIAEDTSTSFVMSGSASIPYGVTESGSLVKAAGKNDVYLGYIAPGTLTGTPEKRGLIKIGGTLTTAGTVATITLGNWKRGLQFLGVSGTYTALADNDLAKFNFTEQGWNKEKYTITNSNDSAKVNSPVYVAGSTSRLICSAPPASGANGTITKPYATISDALGASDLSEADNKITIDGTLGAQEIASTTTLATGVSSVTLQGYKESSTAASSARIDANKAANTSALKIEKSGLTVTIQDLLITGGTDGGAGICLLNGTIKLGDGAVIKDNVCSEYGKLGGGVYVGTDATLFMYGKSLIGDMLTTDSGIATATSTAGDYGNYGGAGGGIYNAGTVYMGADYLNGTTPHANAIAEGYGVVRNRSDINNGGGIYNTGTLQILSGEISYNMSGSSGGGVHNYKDGSSAAAVTISGGSFISNKAAGTSGSGGAIYNSGGTITMTAGKIGEDGKPNTASISGGAIYQNGTFTVSGTAFIYPGSEKSNDVYLSGDKTITIASKTLTGGDTVATITPNSWTRGRQILGVSGVTVTDEQLTLLGQKFSLSEAGWDKENVSTTGVKINSPIYVAGSTDRAICSAPVTTDANGTKVKPYATIVDALGDSDLAGTSYTITVDGKLGSQTIGSGATLPSGGAITVKGYDANAKIDGGGTARALLLSKSGLTTTIKDLKITNGKNTEGAGIKVENGILKLTDGAIVTGNDGSDGNGGGVYVSSGASLFMYGKALIGDNAKSTTTATNTSSSTYANKAKNGAGIYNYGGSVYLGYSAAGSASPLTSNDTDGYFGVNRNYATESGGGIYHAYGTLQIASGNVSYNQSATSGGAVYFDYVTGSDSDTTLSAGSVKGNKSGVGGALYIKSSKSVTVSGAMAINGNTATSRGGAVYNKGTFKITGSSTFNDNTASSTTADVYGGALYNCPSCVLEITGSAEIKNNTASTTKSGCSAYGGAIMNDQGSITMSAGTIGASGALNYIPANTGTSRYGGAIYQNGTFTVSGSAFIYPGSENSNDVYLKENKTITLGTTSLSAYTGSNKMVITPEVWKRGATFLGGTNVAGNISKFACSDSDWSVVQSSSVGVFDTGTTIYVSESAISGITGGVAGDDTTGRGTQKYPYATIQKAATETWKAQAYTISVNGTLTATKTTSTTGKGNLQNIPNDTTNIKATSITLSGTNSATINGNSKGTAFTLNKNIPVTITNIKFTGGQGSKGNGIYIATGTVKLGDGVVISGNYNESNGSDGGGVYVDTSGTLFMYGSSLIGDKTASSSGIVSAELGKDFTGGYKCANRCQGSGGGIYNKGKVYIGYQGYKNDGTTPDPKTMSTGYGVVRNASNGSGGGIANYGTLMIGSGDISYNHSGSTGGGIDCQADTTMSGGNICGNTSVTGGGGFYITNGKSVVISGGNVNSNETSYGNGGGIYNIGTLTLSDVTFTDNKVTTYGSGGAIYQKGTLNMSGAPYMKDDDHSEKINDIYLPSGYKVYVTDRITSIYAGYITPASWPTGGSTVSVLDGPASALSYSFDKFWSSIDGYMFDETGNMR